MNTRQARYRNVRLVTLDDQGYLACKRRYALERAERKRQEREQQEQERQYAECKNQQAAAAAQAAGTPSALEFLPIEAYVEGSLARVVRQGADGLIIGAAGADERMPSYGEAARGSQTQPAGREAGQNIGQLVERAARRWLGAQVKLESRRILAWREQRGEQSLSRYAELDAVYAPDYDALSVYEIKFTSAARMQGQAGQGQLDRAALLLATEPRYRRILKRLVYVGNDDDALLPGVASVRADDDRAACGVVWIAPHEIEAAARDLGITLPPTGRNPL